MDFDHHRCCPHCKTLEPLELRDKGPHEFPCRWCKMRYRVIGFPRPGGKSSELRYRSEVIE